MKEEQMIEADLQDLKEEFSELSEKKIERIYYQCLQSHREQARVKDFVLIFAKREAKEILEEKQRLK